jgi:hypothetical protein
MKNIKSPIQKGFRIQHKIGTHCFLSPMISMMDKLMKLIKEVNKTLYKNNSLALDKERSLKTVNKIVQISTTNKPLYSHMFNLRILKTFHHFYLQNMSFYYNTS